MKVPGRTRSILHLDLDPFFVSVERSLDPDLRGRPLIVGGDPEGTGMVAAASSEARAAGVRTGQSIARARELCPQAVVKPGDLDTYARVSQDVTSILLSASRRVERPSADEAYVDLSRDGTAGASPVPAAERIKDEIQRHLGLDVSLGLASSRLAARVASTWARPRGLLVVLPGYESSFLGRQPLAFLPDLPAHLESALKKGGLTTLGDLGATDLSTLAALVGEAAAARLQQAARGEGEPPIPVTAPPTAIQEEAAIRDRRGDRVALEEVLDSLARKAWARLRPFELVAGAIAVEVRRGESTLRRDESFEPGVADEETVRSVVRSLGDPLLEPTPTVKGLLVRLGRLSRHGRQVPLFPEIPGVARRR